MIRLFVIVVLATTALVSPPWARSRDDNWKQCRTDNPDEQKLISGCTALIQSGHESRRNVVIALSIRCNVYHLKGENDQAIADCSSAITLDRSFLRAYLLRAAAYISNGEYDRAIEDYTKLIQLSGHFSDFVYRSGLFADRGGSYASKGQYDRAMEDFDQALRLMPNNPLVFNNRGLAYFLKGEYDRAIEDYTMAIQLLPNYPSPLINRCETYAIIGHFDQALSDCNRVLSVSTFETHQLYSPADDPYSRSIYYQRAVGNRGFTYLKMGLYDLAIADYDAALKKGEVPTFRYGRGLAKEKKGDATGAAADIAAANQLDAGVADQFVKWGIAATLPTAAPNAPGAAMPVPPTSSNVAASVTAARSAATVVMDYLTAADLAAAGTDVSAARKSFLSSGCKDDMVTEFKANKESGWSFSGTDTKIVSEKVNAEDGKATVVARVVYKGGTSSRTFMSKKQKFFLTVENGAWRISEMDLSCPLD